MEKFALIIDGRFVEARYRSSRPADIPHKKVVWLPFVEEMIDNSTGLDTVSSTVRNVIEAARVVTTTTIRDKTAEELSDEKNARQENAFQQTLASDSAFKALAISQLQIIKKINALAANGTGSLITISALNKTPVTTKAHFKLYLKGIM